MQHMLRKEGNSNELPSGTWTFISAASAAGTRMMLAACDASKAGSLLVLGRQIELLAEALNATGRVHEALLACVERMALRANIDS